jgi:hypothetical protein
MPTPRGLLRAALRLHETYLARAAQAAEQALLVRLADYQPALERARAALRQTGAAGAPDRPFTVRRHLHGLLTVVRSAVSQTSRLLVSPSSSALDLRHLLEELRQLDDEFGGLSLDFKKKTLSVTTEAIELEEVYLGPFTLRLAWERLAPKATSHCLEVVALDPHPAAANHAVTHPHVHTSVLCAGDATVPIQRALEQGRLADAFCLVRSVLTTYNPSSPHVALAEWGGQECRDCGSGTHADDLSYCEPCGHDYCQDCIRCCRTCQESRCGDCLARCPVCQEAFCSSCLLRSAHSGKECCRDCLQTCTACGAGVASDELDEQTRLCPSCCPDEPESDPDRPDEENPTIPEHLPTESDQCAAVRRC